MKWLQKLVQLFWVKPFFKIFFNLKVSGLEFVKNLSGPLLIIGNHKFFIDSFALGAALPLFSKIFPMRVMGKTDFNHPGLIFLRKIGIIKLIYSLFGVFPTLRGQGLETALKIPKKIIEKGGTVFLHPEGGVIHEKGVGQFKRGAPALALMTGVKILPVAFNIDKKNFRGNYSVKFGPIFTLPQNLTIEQGAEYMREIIIRLYQDPIFH